MKTKKIVSNSLLYGIGDMLVMAVGGFLLIPLYTRTLSQEEYGFFLIFQTNTDLFTYAVHFGLISAISRLYFDYKRTGTHYEYLSSILFLFILLSTFTTVIVLNFGDGIWNFLSPQVPVYPYLYFCLVLSILSFFYGFVMMWLRVENKVAVFVVVQVIIACSLLALAVYVLFFREGGLEGLLWVLILNGVLSALILPLCLRKKIKFVFSFDHIFKTLHFAAPIALSYFAYFLINRGSMVVLQRYVAVEEVAVFGLAQQMAMIVIVASNAFTKTLQPIIYGSELNELTETVEKSGKFYFMMMAFLVGIMALFSSEILAIAAPSKYDSGYFIFVILVFANFIYSLTFLSNSVILYYKKSFKSLSIMVFGGLSAILLNLILIPEYGVYGASIALVVSSFLILSVSCYQARRLIEKLNLNYILIAIPSVLVVTVIAASLRYVQAGFFWILCIKIALASSLIYMMYRLVQQKKSIKA